MKNPQSKKKAFDQFIRYSGISFQMLAIILVGVYAGIKLDKLVRSGFPYFTVGLTLLSVILAIYYAVKDFIKSK